MAFHEQSSTPPRFSSLLKWAAFVVQVLVLCMLLIITFMGPPTPFKYRLYPQIAILIGLSVLVSAATGALFLRGSKSSTMSLANLISSPPCVVGMTVIAIVVVPVVIGFLIN